MPLVRSRFHAAAAGASPRTAPGRRAWLGDASRLLAVVGVSGLAPGRPFAAEPAAPAIQSGPVSAAAPAAARAEIPLPPVGSRIVLPDLDLLDGRRLDAAARAGRTTVLYWWASWCPFCAEQSPLMDRLAREQGPDGLLVLGLSIDRDPKTAADHLARKGYRFPSAWLSPALARELPKPKGLPVTVVLAPDGTVLAAESGQMFEEDVAALSKWAAAGAAAPTARRPG